MPWFKVDDRFWSHPVTSELSDAATALWIRAGSWSACHLTDGVIPKSKLKALGSRMRAAQELVDAGLWTYSATSETFSSQNWAKYQPEKAQVLKKREDTKKRVNDWRNGKSNAVTESVSNASPDPTRTQPLLTTAPKALEFDEFWSLWPRKEGKANALKAYEKAVKKISEADLLTKARDYALSPNRPDVKFVPHAATWLNGERWSDETPAVATPVDPNAWMIAQKIELS